MGEAERYGTYKAQNTGTLNPYAMGNVPGQQADPTTTLPSSNSAVPMKADPSTYNLDYGQNQAAIPMGQASDNWSRTPGYGQGQTYLKTDGTNGNANGDGRDEEKPVDFNWNAYLKDLEDATRMTQETTAAMVGPGGGPQVSVGAPPPQTFTTSRSAFDNVGRGGGGGGSYGGSVYQGPVFDYPELNLPEPFEYGATLDLPDYEAPEYDESQERSVREEFIQTNKGSLSKAAQQAILGSANVNNPQARGAIITAALEGFGEALGQTALKGSQEGRRSAEGKHRRDVGIYNAQFDVASKEALAGYDQSMREDMMNWELELNTAQADFGNQLAQWNRQPADIRAQNMPS